MQKQTAMLFPTMVGVMRVPQSEEVNAMLRALILERERTHPDQQYANVGGWHSSSDLLEWASPAIGTLRGWIQEAVQHMIGSTMEYMRSAGITRPSAGALALTAWANVSRRGNYHSIHNHPGSCWSGVYYVSTGGAAPAEHPKSGVIDLLDPRPFTEMVYVPGDPYGQKVPFRPEPGMMLVFPGFLYHFVHPHFGDGERISVAFNTQASPQRAPASAGML